MHPGAWIVWSLCAALVTMSTTNPFYLLPIVSIAFVVYAACRVEGPTTRSFRMFVVVGLVTMAVRTSLAFATPLVSETSLTTGLLATALLEGLRLAVLLIVFGTFNSVSDPFRLLRLAPRRFHEPALAAALALSLAPRTIASVGRVREAQRLRGLDTGSWRAVPALVVPVLETGMEEALTLAESMDARGHGRGRRTRYRSEPWSAEATTVIAASCVAAAAFVTALVRGTGSLVVGTSPLVWPDASWLLLGGVLLLGVPALAVRSRR